MRRSADPEQGGPPTDHPPTDGSLVRAARLGDQGAYRQIVDRYGPGMFRYARTLVGHEQDAGDVVQEAFVSAWKGLPTFRGDSSLKTWLYRLVHRRAMDHHRKRRPVPVEDEAFADLLADASGDRCGRRRGRRCSPTCAAPSPSCPRRSAPAGCSARWRVCSTRRSRTRSVSRSVA